MYRIVNHHTGGRYTPNATDRKHYHNLIDGDGAIHAGDHPIAANAPGRKLVAGQYAGHTAMLNTGAIGNSVCSMYGGRWGAAFDCTYFPRIEQLDALVELNARQCIEYSIPVTRERVLSHAEVEPTLGVKQKDKWDFDYDPFRVLTTRDPIVIGDAFRARVRAVIEAMGQGHDTAGQGASSPAPALDQKRPLLLRGARGADVSDMQNALIRHGAKISADGAFGPKTWTALVAFQKARQLLPDGKCGPLTWTALMANK